jgi:hypothetical protein
MQELLGGMMGGTVRRMPDFWSGWTFGPFFAAAAMLIVAVIFVYSSSPCILAEQPTSPASERQLLLLQATNLQSFLECRGTFNDQLERLSIVSAVVLVLLGLLGKVVAERAPGWWARTFTGFQSLLLLGAIVALYSLAVGLGQGAARARSLAGQASSIVSEAGENSVSDGRLSDLQARLDQISRATDNLIDRPTAPAPVVAAAFTPVPAATADASYRSCFISYSTFDREFTDKLYADLNAKNAHCWYAPRDLPIGVNIRAGIDDAVRNRDRFILVLSTQSLSSSWVEEEVEDALAVERSTGTLALIPIRLDDAIMRSSAGWATVVRTRNIGDMRDWSNPDAYWQNFNRLLGALGSASNDAPTDVQ